MINKWIKERDSRIINEDDSLDVDRVRDIYSLSKDNWYGFRLPKEEYYAVPSIYMFYHEEHGDMPVFQIKANSHKHAESIASKKYGIQTDRYLIEEIK